MESAMVIGVYKEIGFQLCKIILEQGVEVEGVHIHIQQSQKDCEEKLLQIGRNANYHEWMPPYVKIEHVIDKKMVVFVDLHEKLEHLTFLENELMDTLASKKSKIILLLPIILLKSQNLDTENKLNNFLQKGLQFGTEIIRIHLPISYDQPDKIAQGIMELIDSES